MGLVMDDVEDTGGVGDGGSRIMLQILVGLVMEDIE